MKKAVLALSGGLDSATVLAKLLDENYEVICYTFTYGSKHNQYENRAAFEIAAHYNVTCIGPIDLSNITSCLTSSLLISGGDIPEGHYTDKSMASTVVPGRNIMFLSILAGIAMSQKADRIAIGIHQGDHAIYPDCRPDFYKAMNKAIYYGTGRLSQLIAPFLFYTKGMIVEWGLRHGVPVELTRTCYKDQEIACGVCGACVERLEAFAENKVADPVIYEEDIRP